MSPAFSPFFTKSEVRATTNGTLPPSSVQANATNAEPHFWRMRSICVRTASMSVFAGSCPITNFVSPTVEADSRSASTAEATPAAAPFFNCSCNAFT